MIGAPNSLNLNCKVRVMKEAPGPSVSEEIADIFRNYNIDIVKTSSYFCHAMFFIAAYGGVIYPYSPLCEHIYMLHEIWCQIQNRKIQGARSKWYGVTHFGVS